MKLEAAKCFAMSMLVLAQGNVLFHNVKDYFGVITLVSNNIHPRCIIILHPSSNSTEKLLGALGGVRVSVVRLETYRETQNILCQNREQPLIVILSSTAIVKKKLELLSLDDGLSEATWLLFLNKDFTLNTFFFDINIPFDCEFLIARSTGEHTRNIELIEVHRVTAETALLTYPFATWSNKESKVTNTTLYERRNSLHGIHLKGVSTDDPPFTILENSEEKGIAIGGFMGDVWNILQGTLEFSTTFQVENTFGVVTNGSWNGMIEMLRTKQIDVAVSEFTLTDERMQVVDFAIPIIYTRYQVFIQKPRHENLTWSDFLEPFSRMLWLTVCFSILVLSLFLSILHSFGRRFGNEESIGPSRYTFNDSLHYMFGIFCQQGHEFTPRAMSCRMVYFTAYIIAVVVYAAYSAALISFLTEKTATLPFRDLRGLLKDGTYDLGLLRDSAEFNLFSNSNDSVLKEVYEKFLVPESSLPETDEEGIYRLCSRKYAYVSAGLAMSGHTFPCDVTKLPDVGFPVSLSLAFVKGSPYKGLINYNLLELRDKGTMKRLRGLWWTSKSAADENVWSTVAFNSVVPVLVVLAAGMVTAAVVLVMEYHWNNVQRLRSQKQSSPAPNDFHHIKPKIYYNNSFEGEFREC
ncbi:Ionotropic receptor 113 [Blattella germanica]|nr:Ionotropic receptor 113 [Blattella germanica]